MDGYNYLINHIKNNNDRIEIARIKNSFLSSSNKSNGYRDTKINVIFKSIINNKPISMICEIQLILVNMLSKKKNHIDCIKL